MIRLLIALLCLLATPVVAQTSYGTPNGVTLGKTERQTDGRIVAYDAQGRVLGSYDPRTNTTYDSQKQYFGRGDQTSGLIAYAPRGQTVSPQPQQQGSIVQFQGAVNNDPLTRRLYGADGMTPNNNHGYSAARPMPNPPQTGGMVNYPEFSGPGGREHLPDMGDPRGVWQQRYITREDQQLAYLALQDAGRHSHHWTHWKNPRTGSYGSYYVYPGTPYSQGGSGCKQFMMKITIVNMPHPDGSRIDTTDMQDQVACQQGGRWVVVRKQHKW